MIQDIVADILRNLLQDHMADTAVCLLEHMEAGGWTIERSVKEQVRSGIQLRKTAVGWMVAPTPRIDGFAARLRQAREAAQMTQEALAHALGYSGRSMVCHYEAGTAKPTLEVVVRMAEVLGVDAIWLSGLGG